MSSLRTSRLSLRILASGVLAAASVVLAAPAAATSCVEPSVYVTKLAQEGGSVYVGEVVRALPERDGRRYWEVRVERALAGPVPARVVVSAEVVTSGAPVVAGAREVQLEEGPLFMVDTGDRRIQAVCSASTQNQVEEAAARYEQVLRDAGVPAGRVVAEPAPSTPSPSTRGPGEVDPEAQANDVLADGGMSEGAAWALAAGAGVLGVVLGGTGGFMLARRRSPSS